MRRSLFLRSDSLRGNLPLLGRRDALLRRTEDFWAYKHGDHLGADAPPLLILTHLYSRPPDGSNVEILSGFSRGIGGQLAKLAMKPEGLGDQEKRAWPWRSQL